MTTPLRSDQVHIVGQESEEEELRDADGLRTYSIAEAWANDKGEQLAAISGKRTLTLKDLNNRIAQMMGNVPAAAKSEGTRDLDIEAKRRQEVADSVLQDWAENVTLALEAERSFKVTDQEISESLAKLAAPPAQGPIQGAPQAAVPIRGIGIPEEQLREETRDGLLIEKYINDVQKKQYDDNFYRKLFQQNPSAFLIPPRVRAFQVFRVIPPHLTEKQKKQIKVEMDNLWKELKKRNPDYKALSAKADPNEMLAIGETGWITADAVLPPPLRKALFMTDVGKTTDVFEDVEQNSVSFTSPDAGIVLGQPGGQPIRVAHIVRILEREEGTKQRFEDAKPQLMNYTFSKTKHIVYAQLQGKYKVEMAADGLTKKREVAKEEYEQYVIAKQKELGATRGQKSPARRAASSTKGVGTAAQPAAKPQPAPPQPNLAKPTPVPPPPAVDLDSLPPPPTDRAQRPTGNLTPASPTSR